MKQVYAPGCALMIYKPELAKKVLEFLNKDFNDIPEHLICCRHEPNLENDTQVINTCPSCDRRYRELYEGIATISLWEILAESRIFPLHNGGKKPRYIIDLLFGETTGTFEPDAWHDELQKFIDTH